MVAINRIDDCVHRGNDVPFRLRTTEYDHLDTDCLIQRHNSGID